MAALLALTTAAALPPSTAVAASTADELGPLPLTVTAAPGRLQVVVEAGEGVLEVLLNEQPIARAAHVSDVVIDVRYGNAQVLRMDKLLDGHRCTNLRASLDGAGAVSVSVTGVGSTDVEDATRRTLRLKLC